MKDTGLGQQNCGEVWNDGTVESSHDPPLSLLGGMNPWEGGLRGTMLGEG